MKKYIIIIIIIVIIIIIIYYYKQKQNNTLLLLTDNEVKKTNIINELNNKNIVFFDIESNKQIYHIVIDLFENNKQSYEYIIEFKIQCYFEKFNNILIEKSNNKYIEFKMENDIEQTQSIISSNEKVKKTDRGIVLYVKSTKTIIIVTHKTTIDSDFIEIGYVKLGFNDVKKIKKNGGIILKSGIQ